MRALPTAAGMFSLREPFRQPARLAAFVAAGAVAAHMPQGAQARTLRPADVERIVTLEQPAISPDGRRVAFVANVPVAGRGAYRSELRQIDVATRETRTLARDDASDPRWSPDGRRLAYIATAPGNRRAQVFVRDEASGGVRAATAAAADVVDFAWRPDGRALAFAAYDPQPFRGRHAFFEAGDNEYTATSRPASIHLWLVPASGGAAQRLTSGSWTLPPTDRTGIFTPQFAWMAGGRQILYARLVNPAPGDDDASSLWRLELATGRSTHLTHHEKLALSPQVSADGARIAYWYPRDGDFLSENEVHVLSGRRDVALTHGLDRNVGGSLWMPGDRSLLICADDGTRVRAWTVSLAGERRRLDLGTLDIVCDSYSSSTFDAGIAASVSRGGAIAFLAADSRSARELYYLSSATSKPQRLTNVNAFVRALDLGAMRTLRWQGPAGSEDGVLTYPPNLRAGRRYPVVLLIHGGPGLASVADFAWESWPLAHLIAAHGYLVFQPNYRGSDGDGNAYMHAIYRDTVEGPARDIMSGLGVVGRLPHADPTRVAVSGWSYGGLLTSWLTTRYHDWRAAVSGAAVNDEVESYDLSLSNVQNRYYFGMSPYDPGGAAFYRSQSPIAFARRITTPTLIWSATGDPVVPISMSYAMFHALKDNRVPVKFVVFPTATHGPATPADVEDLTTLWLDWLDRYLRPHRTGDKS